MVFFLERIAASVRDEFGNTLNRHCLVFPNRRAGLYFMKHLAAGIQKPVWLPAIYTVNELFRSYSLLQPAGTEFLLFDLFRSYSSLSKKPGSFDDFYFWGDMVLNDFDDVDKYLVDAEMLFANVKDIKTIDHQFGSLSDEQKLVIKTFWTNFEIEKPTGEKKDFSALWEILSDLYADFRRRLREKNLAYEGMIFRDLAEMNENEIVSATSWDMVHFIGFNALNECEKKVMMVLKNSGKARFYWDYDNKFISEGDHNSAGYFMKDNLRLFGNDMPPGWSYDTLVNSPSVKRRVIESSSDVSQVKLVPKLISEIPGLTPGNAHQSAVVLADENLLLPLLTSLPENGIDINITMGYPLRQTLVYSFIKHLMDLQQSETSPDGAVRFSAGCVNDILRHPLLERALPEKDLKISEEIIRTSTARVAEEKFSGSEILSAIFRRQPDPASLSAYFRDALSLIALRVNPADNESPGNEVQNNLVNEFIYRIVLSVNRLESIVASPDVSFTTGTYISMLDRLLRTQSVPFSGEPLSGIQMMGILETRTLDFKNLIVLSANEGVLPAISSSSSFIPFSLREAFGLPSLNHQESVYAYHFYRLLERAENVTFVYNSNSEGLRSGEMSRFLTAMKYEKDINPVFLNLVSEIRTSPATGTKIERTVAHNRSLLEYFFRSGASGTISPSAINTWLFCRMKFYYRYVNGLKEPERISDDIDPAMLGNLLHDVMHSLYEGYVGKVLSAETLASIQRNDKLLSDSVENSISSKFRNGEEGFVRGQELIVREVLLRHIRKIIHTDISIAPVSLLRLESFVKSDITINDNLKLKSISAGGIADRIDVVKGITRIVDYKTGTVSDSITSIAGLFEDDRKKDHDGWLQTLIYCEAWLNQNNECTVRPSIYKIKKITGGTFSDVLRIKTDKKNDVPVEDYSTIRDEFMTGLRKVISDIFSEIEPFTMTTVPDKCRYCVYNGLCSK